MLDFLLIHGRHDPDEDMQDWGFNGPRLHGVEALHVVYQTSFILHFTDSASADKAHAQTGWEFWDDNALELQFHQDMLKVHPIACDGPMAYYGDWELQTHKAP